MNKNEKEEAEKFFYNYLNRVLDEYKNIFSTTEERKCFKEFFSKYINECPDYEYNSFLEINDLSLKLKEALNEYNCDQRYKDIIVNIIDQSIYDKNSIVVLKSKLNKFKEKITQLNEEIQVKDDLIKSQRNNFDFKKYEKLYKEYKSMSAENYINQINSKDLKLIKALNLSVDED